MPTAQLFDIAHTHLMQKKLRFLKPEFNAKHKNVKALTISTDSSKMTNGTQ
jgi:hypothetical protein